MRRWAARIAIAALASVACILPAHASDNFGYDTNVTYAVQPDGATTAVTEHYTITNRTPRSFLTELKLSTPAQQISNVSATYEDAAPITTAVSKQQGTRGDVSYDYQQIDLTFPKQIYGQDAQWSFTVRYQATGLVDSRGGSHVVYVPAIKPTAGTQSYKVTLQVPNSFGSPHFSGAKSASNGSRDGYQYFTFDQKALEQQSLSLQFGDKNIYKVDFAYPLKNDSKTARDFSVALPPNLNNQQVTINSITPKPLNTKVDGDGNIMASYRLDPGQQLTVHTDAEVTVNWRDYNLAASGKAKDIPDNLRKRYTGSTDYWQTDGDVAAAAASVTKPDAPVADNVHAIYNYVINKLSYNESKLSFNIRQGAAKALANPSNAVCLEYADLTVAMLRSQGIPARMVVGYAYSGGLKASPAVDDSLHAWVEAYIPNVGWTTLDPTWGEKFDEFGKADLDHLAFTVWGDSDQLPAAVMEDGGDTGYQYEQTAISYPVTATASSATKAGLQVQRWQLLPGVSLQLLKVEAPSGVVSASATVTGGKKAIELGDVAPNQHLSLWRMLTGSQSGQLKLVSGGITLATANVSTQTWPQYLILLLIGVALLAVVAFQIRKRGHQPPTST